MEDKKSQIKECNFCGSDSKCLCFDCLLYFCDNCYKLIHDMKKNMTHKKENIDPYISINLKCSEHPKFPVTLFCLEEKSNNIYFYLYY